MSLFATQLGDDGPMPAPWCEKTGLLNYIHTKNVCHHHCQPSAGLTALPHSSINTERATSGKWAYHHHHTIKNSQVIFVYYTMCDNEQTQRIIDKNSNSKSLACRFLTAEEISQEYEPCENVDYLTHQWRESDLWSSWRYVAKFMNRYKNGVRLENASWRSWAKMRNTLQCVSPETLDWCVASAFKSENPFFHWQNELLKG